MSIWGSLIGGFVGFSFAGPIGALIGSEVVRSNKQAHANNGQFVEKEICSLQKIVHTETIEQISGYRLTVEVDGDLITINSNRSYNPGDTLSIRKEIRYSIY